MITRVPSGKVLFIDPFSGTVDGSYISAGSAFTLFYNFGTGIAVNTQFTLLFTPPNGTILTPPVSDPFSSEFSGEFGPADQPAIIAGAVVETTNWLIGELPITTSKNVFSATQYLAYVTGPSEFNVPGIWQMQIIGTGPIGTTDPVAIAVGG